MDTESDYISRLDPFTVMHICSYLAPPDILALHRVNKQFRKYGNEIFRYGGRDFCVHDFIGRNKTTNFQLLLDIISALKLSAPFMVTLEMKFETRLTDRLGAVYTRKTMMPLFSGAPHLVEARLDHKWVPPSCVTMICKLPSLTRLAWHGYQDHEQYRLDDSLLSSKLVQLTMDRAVFGHHTTLMLPKTIQVFKLINCSYFFACLSRLVDGMQMPQRLPFPASIRYWETPELRSLTIMGFLLNKGQPRLNLQLSDLVEKAPKLKKLRTIATNSHVNDRQLHSNAILRTTGFIPTRFNDLKLRKFRFVGHGTCDNFVFCNAINSPLEDGTGTLYGTLEELTIDCSNDLDGVQPDSLATQVNFKRLRRYKMVKTMKLVGIMTIVLPRDLPSNCMPRLTMCQLKSTLVVDAIGVPYREDDLMLKMKTYAPNLRWLTYNNTSFGIPRVFEIEPPQNEP